MARGSAPAEGSQKKPDRPVTAVRAPKRALPVTDERRLRAALASLALRERRIVELRYGLDGKEPQSLRQIGKRVGVSGERVRQLESRALSKLGVEDGMTAGEWVDQAKRVRRPEPGLARHALQAWTLLLLRLGPAYGYELIKRLDQRGFRVSGPRLYRLLRDLERGGLVRSDWAPSSGVGPDRRVYRLTRKGTRQLHDDADVLQRDCESLQRFFTDYADALATRGSNQRTAARRSADQPATQERRHSG